jgi:hypothetical protein
MTLALALALAFCLVLIVSLAWADALEDAERLKANPDITGRLPEMYARPALTRRRGPNRT